MRKHILLIPVCLVALCGCARHYVITMTNGTQIGATGKPHLKGGYYHFKDARGRESVIAAGRITEIAPASMVKPDKGPLIPGSEK